MRRMDETNEEIVHLEKYRKIICEQAENSMQNLFSFIQNGHFTSSNYPQCRGTECESVGSRLNENYADFSYGAAGEKLKDAVEKDSNNLDIKNIIFREDTQDTVLQTVNLLKYNINEHASPQIPHPSIGEFLKILEFEQEKSNIYIKENKLLKKRNDILSDKLRDVICENAQLREFSETMQRSYGGVTNSVEGEKLIKRELEEITKMYDSKVESLQTQLEFFRHSKQDQEEELGKLRRRVAIMESFRKDKINDSGPHLSEKNDLVNEINLLKNKLEDLKQVEEQLIDEVRVQTKLAEDAQLEMTKAYIEKDRLNEDHLESRRRWEGHLRVISESMVNQCLPEEQFIQNKLFNIQEKNKELVVMSNNLEVDLERTKEEEKLVQNAFDDLRSKFVNLDVESNLLTDSMKIHLTQARLDKSHMYKQLKQIKLEASQREEERHAERLRLNEEINSLRKRLFESDKELFHSRDECIILQKNNKNLWTQLNVLDQKRLQLESKLFESLKLSNDGNLTRKSPFTKSIRPLKEKYETKISELEKSLGIYKDLVNKLQGECQVLISQLEGAVECHNSGKNKVKRENEVLKMRLNDAFNDFTKVFGGNIYTEMSPQ